MRIGYRKFVGPCPIVPESESLMWGVDDHYFLLKELVSRGHEVFLLSDATKEDIPYFGPQKALLYDEKYGWLNSIKYNPSLNSVEELDLDVMIIESGPNNVSVNGKTVIKYQLWENSFKSETISSMFNRYARYYGIEKLPSGHDVVDLKRTFMKVPTIDPFGEVSLKRVKKIIRHFYEGDAYVIKYQIGLETKKICVTANHSIILDDGNQCYVGFVPEFLGELNNGSYKMVGWDGNTLRDVKILGVQKLFLKDWVYDLEVKDNHTFLANDVFVHNTFTDGLGLPSMLHTVRLIDSFDGVVFWYLTDLVNPFPIMEMCNKKYRMAIHSDCSAEKLFGKGKKHYVLHHSLDEKKFWDYFTNTLTRCSWGQFPMEPLYVPVPYNERMATVSGEKVYDLTYIGHNYGARDSMFVKYYLPWGQRVNVWGDGWEEYNNVVKHHGRTKNILETVNILAASKMTIFLTSSLSDRLLFIPTRVFEAVCNGCPMLFPPEYSIAKHVPMYVYDKSYVDWLFNDGVSAERLAEMQKRDLASWCDTKVFVDTIEKYGRKTA